MAIRPLGFSLGRRHVSPRGQLLSPETSHWERIFDLNWSRWAAGGSLAPVSRRQAIRVLRLQSGEIA
jgi:hypothetical protein